MRFEGRAPRAACDMRDGCGGFVDASASVNKPAAAVAHVARSARRTVFETQTIWHLIIEPSFAY